MRMKAYTAILVMTPLIRADTWLGAAGCASGSQTCSGTSPAFDPAPISATISTAAATETLGWWARIEFEGVVPSATCQQAEGEQQRQAAEGGHDEIHKAGLGVSLVAMMRHDQRPRGQRHQLPCEEKREGIVSDGDQDHAGEERRVERQNPFGVRLVAPVAEREQAGACAPEFRSR